MLKKTIAFKDLDGNDVQDDFYFNLNKAEIAKLELSHSGGLSGFLQQIIRANKGDQIIEAFEDIIKMSVGRRSEDNRQFEKSEAITNAFMQTDAYTVLFMELLTDAEKSAAFVRGMMPADLAAEISDDAVAALTGEQKVETLSLPGDDDRPAWIKENRDPTPQERMAMSPAQMNEAWAAREARDRKE